MLRLRNLGRALGVNRLLEALLGLKGPCVGMLTDIIVSTRKISRLSELAEVAERDLGYNH